MATRADLEREYGIPPEKYCGLSPAEMSRVIVACHSAHRQPGEPVGFWPVISVETQLGRLSEAFGPDVDVERLRLLEQFFSSRVNEALQLDWMLDNAAFDRAVHDGLSKHFPELSDDARRVIAGNYSYSHAK